MSLWIAKRSGTGMRTIAPDPTEMDCVKYDCRVRGFWTPAALVDAVARTANLHNSLILQ
jgi:hypothetical protein